MWLTNTLLGVIIFILINILGEINTINSKMQYSDGLVRGPIIRKVKD